MEVQCQPLIVINQSMHNFKLYTESITKFSAFHPYAKQPTTGVYDMPTCPPLFRLDGALLFVTFLSYYDHNYYIYVLVQNATLWAFHLQVTQDAKFKLCGGFQGLRQSLLAFNLQSISKINIIADSRGL